MNQTLKEALAPVHSLPEQQQARLAGLIEEFVEHVTTDTFEEDMKDPEYRAHVEAALAEGEEDIEAGRLTPIKNVPGTIERDFKAKHGL